MKSMLSPEAEELVDALVGVAAFARRARHLIEASAIIADPPTTLKPASDDFVLALIGVVSLARKLEVTLDAWRPQEPAEAASEAPVALMRSFLR